MHGNVAEWVLDEFIDDYYSQFKSGVADDPLACPTKIFPHVVRGGSWEADPEECRSAARAGSDPVVASPGPADSQEHLVSHGRPACRVPHHPPAGRADRGGEGRQVGQDGAQDRPQTRPVVASG